MNNLLVDKIFSNIKKNDIAAGCIIASISKSDPNYYYHWIRDAAIVMRSIIRYYRKSSNLSCFKQCIDYLNIEYQFQLLPTLSGLGEPKFNVDKTTFDDSWGRPQNDGPALRGLVMLELLVVFEDYPLLLESIRKILYKDINYILQNIHEPCFDIWEEVYGYHLYTRGVQYKFLKELYIKNIFPDLQDSIIKGKGELFELLQHHQITMTSFNLEGHKCREYDTSLLLLASHVDYDREIVDITNNKFKDYIKKMLRYYRQEYPINNVFQGKIILLGRYQNDKYYNGNPWIICSLAYYQLLVKYQELKIDFMDYDIHNFTQYLESFANLNIPEQINRFDGRHISAHNLTWNYAEMLTLYHLVDDYVKNKC